MPTDWLLLTAGMKYTHYKSKDRGLQEKIANIKEDELKINGNLPIQIHKVPEIPSETLYSECANGGNANGYLKNTILPKYSITSNLGLCFLDERLELGTRLVYHTNVKETRNRSLREAGFRSNGNNNPRWQPVFLVDAYVNYQFSENLNLSLSATNLTDRYYLDPMTRSSMPAPGRTIKLGLTTNF